MAEGLSEWTITGALKNCEPGVQVRTSPLRLRGENPIERLEKGERPKVSDTPERRIYLGDELAQTLAASREPWPTLFRLARSLAGVRASCWRSGGRTST